MLTKMNVFSSSQLSASAFEFDEDGNANLDKIQIHDVEGLDPVAAAVNLSQYGSVDGAFFTGATVPERNIVLTVGFRPDWADYAIEDLRAILYHYFMPKQTVELHFESTHLPEVKINGICESMTPNLFSVDPEIQISIICPDPYFYAVESDSVSGKTSLASAQVVTPITYVGTVDTPMYVTVKSNATVTTYTSSVLFINTTIEQKSLSIAVSPTINNVEYLWLNTDDSNRDIGYHVIANGLETSVLRKLGVVDWIKLKSGLNNFAVITTTAGLDWEMTYTPKFGGL